MESSQVTVLRLRFGQPPRSCLKVLKALFAEGLVVACFASVPLEWLPTSLARLFSRLTWQIKVPWCCLVSQFDMANPACQFRHGSRSLQLQVHSCMFGGRLFGTTSLIFGNALDLGFSRLGDLSFTRCANIRGKCNRTGKSHSGRKAFITKLSPPQPRLFSMEVPALFVSSGGKLDNLT